MELAGGFSFWMEMVDIVGRNSVGSWQLAVELSFWMENFQVVKLKNENPIVW